MARLAGWIKTFVQAIDHHDPAAQWQIGKYYLEGSEVKRDQIEAFAWFTLAAEQNYKAAMAACDALKTKLSPEDLDDASHRGQAWKTR